MHVSRLLLLTLLGGCDVLEPLIQGTPDARPRPTVDAGPVGEQATEAHNRVRAAATPVPVPALEAMYWDEEAAVVALDWAQRCLWRHSGTAGFGENLYASTSVDDTIAEAVGSWASEAADYSYAANSCSPNRQCGHYTQIVWRDSLGVGCASWACDTGSPFSTSSRWIYWVCNYVPPGNYVGERPY